MGDRVRLISSYSELTFGRIYEVLEVQEFKGEDAIILMIKSDRNNRIGVFAWRFEKVNIDLHQELKRMAETGEGNVEEIIKLLKLS